MIRMKPEAYKGEAHRRIASVTLNLIPTFGEWNTQKITEEMERELKNRRLNRDETHTGVSGIQRHQKRQGMVG